MLENVMNVLENNSDINFNPSLSTSTKNYLSNDKTNSITAFNTQAFSKLINTSSDFNTIKNTEELTYDEFFKILSKYSSNDDYEPLIEFLNEKSNYILYPDFILKSFDKLDDTQKLSLILSILSSDMDIFQSWYKKILMKCLKSNDVVLSSRAQDILDLYSNRFEVIK